MTPTLDVGTPRSQPDSSVRFCEVTCLCVPALREERGGTETRLRYKDRRRCMRSFETSATSRTASLAPSSSLWETATSPDEKLCESCCSADISREGEMGGACNTQDDRKREAKFLLLDSEGRDSMVDEV